VSTSPASPNPSQPDGPLNEVWRQFLPKPQNQWDSFELRKDGVYYRDYIDIRDPDNPTQTKRIFSAVRICSRLEVTALSRNDLGSAWGKVLRWGDYDGKSHQWSTPASLLVKGGTDLVEMLAGEGLDIVHGKGARVKEYIHVVQPSARLVNVSRTGWYTMSHTGTRVFVLPDRVIGKTVNGEGVVYQPESYKSAHDPIRTGSLEDWQKHVAAYCMDNNLLTFPVSMAFAAPVLELLNEQSGGFHLRGESSKGKTTALAAAGSVWGNPMNTWRTTDNALEDTAERHNDVLLPLDELSQVDPKKAIDIVYMLGNGEGKDRSSPTLEMQRKKRWRLLFLSTGEISLVDHVEGVGGKPKAGTEMRMVELDADARSDMGIFQFIHGFEKPSDFADYLTKEACPKYRGVAGPIWAEYLIHRGPAVVKELDAMITGFINKMVPAGAGGEIHRVARRFAVVGAAGELATEAGITGWKSGMAWMSAQWCFERWLEKRSLGSSDIEKAIRHLRSFLQSNGDSRFDVIGQNGQHDTMFSVRDRAGFRRRTEDGETEFFILPEVFDTEAKDFSEPRKLAQELLRRRYLRVEEPGRLQVQQRIPGMGKLRFYAVQNSIFEEGSEPSYPPVPEE
jgi:putative DNA primase/helicase